MVRPVIPAYFPDKCMGCETLGVAITERDKALDEIGSAATRASISKASRLGLAARKLCEIATDDCSGIATQCMYE